jgi:hypothetical protein
MAELKRTKSKYGGGQNVSGQLSNELINDLLERLPQNYLVVVPTFTNSSGDWNIGLKVVGPDRTFVVFNGSQAVSIWATDHSNKTKIKHNLSLRPAEAQATGMPVELDKQIADWLIDTIARTQIENTKLRV